MNLKDRLVKLETKHPNPPLVIFYRASQGMSGEQRARIDEATANGQPVKIIRFTRSEDDFTQDPVTLSWTRRDQTQNLSNNEGK